MQSNLTFAILGLLAALIAITIAILHTVNYFSRKQLAKRRSSLGLDEIYMKDFQHLDRERFGKVWDGLSSALEMPPDKLSPGDTISDLAKGRHLPEIFFEQIEIYLADNGLKPGELSVDLTVKEIVEKLAKRQTAA